MEFLRQLQKRKILRTRLYGDQEFTRFELELLHTPVLQRLYDLKQLGFTDRVYPDAVHARFNHIIGAMHVVDRMVDRLIGWLQTRSTSEFTFHAEVNGSEDNRTDSVTGEQLAHLLAARRPAIRRAFSYAAIYALLGRADEAIAALEQGVEAHFRRETGAILPFVPMDPVFDPIRGHPRFNALLERAKLPRYTAQAK